MTRAGLTQARIVAAALALAEERGADALTMRAVARRLGVDPMALYRHVADKAALLGAMCDATIAALTPLDPAGPWESQIRRMVDELRAQLLARPALVPVLLGAPSTPAATAVAHRAVALLVHAGLDERRAAAAFGAIFSYAMGAIAIELAEPPPAADEGALRAGTAALLGESEPEHLDTAVALMQSPGFVEDGLDLLLAGLRSLLPAAAGD